MAGRAPTFEFHISRQARDLYRFDETLFSLTGSVVFANFHAARVFARQINHRRDLARFPEQAVKAGQINALGLIDEILHYVVNLYRQQQSPQVMAQVLDWLEERLGKENVDETLLRFVDEFPPLSVYRREIAPQSYLAGETGGVPHRQMALEELLMLWLANANPACAPFMELFDDAALEKDTIYRQMIVALQAFFETQPPFGPDDQNLIDMLHSPAVAEPHSLSGQLEYIRERWGPLLGRYLYRLLGGLDLIREEEKASFIGPGPARTYEFTGMEAEAERYSPDRDWMPRVVLLAKSTYVWLDQLAKKYGRPITRLDQVPDEELDTLARWGFTSLWLIGLWERSGASRRIKQLCGNPDAVASAYSLYDYRIADELGGDEAFQNLKARAWQRGIRMAGDMVPNHVGIDARWVIEHPDWFVSLDYNPFPSYTFNGPDLSWDDRVGIFIEDHYYDRTDAAVVFKRVDRWTGDERYIYHGNDGTAMPWNDTAQINFLHPEAREAVIQTILHVARKFPVIRFDAAMTLAKRHYQRLWFPEPGTGGDIPTRAEHGMTRDQFNEAMPQEFWREVVDRVAQEAPDTLLLAEAFWLMEGYFVRTLGMHRVYNSAFMNMLKAEENAKYRTSIKNVLEFDPQILKRFVNFMNNPDEETAVAQFGKDDKYFGVCIMMITMPGLPMFGHGQVEGLTEKYGMEYRRAYWDEQPDEDLIRRHEREVFPLLHRRYLFAGVENFYLYDFYAPEGHVNENVFAYSNRAGDPSAGPWSSGPGAEGSGQAERALVVYHNTFAEARGWIRTSVAYSAPTGGDGGGGGGLVQKTLGEGLGLHNDDCHFCIFRDHITGLEYIRSSKELHEKGLYVELGAFKYHVFLDFYEVQDNEWRHYAHLTAFLNGRGVPSIDEALKETFLQPIHHAFKELVNVETFRRLADAREAVTGVAPDEALLDEVAGQAEALLREVVQFSGGAGDPAALAEEMRCELEMLLSLPADTSGTWSDEPGDGDLLAYLDANRPEDPFGWGALLSWWAVHALGRAVGQAGYEAQSRSWIDEWLLGKVIGSALQDFGLDEPAAWRAVGLVKLLTTHQRWFEAAGPSPHGRAFRVLDALLQDDDVRQFVQVNRYQGVLWFNQEAFETLLWWLTLLALVGIEAPAGPDSPEMSEAYQIVQLLRSAAEKSEFRVEKLLSLV